MLGTSAQPNSSSGQLRDPSSSGRSKASLSSGLPVSHLPIAIPQLLPVMMQGPQAEQHVGPGTLFYHL